MRSLVLVALFTSAEKTQSKSKFRRFVMVLLAFLRKRTLLLLVISSWAAFYLFVVTHESVTFSCNFVKDATRSLDLISFSPEQTFHYIHVCEVISAYRVVYF